MAMNTKKHHKSQPTNSMPDCTTTAKARSDAKYEKLYKYQHFAAKHLLKSNELNKSSEQKIIEISPVL